MVRQGFSGGPVAISGGPRCFGGRQWWSDNQGRGPMTVVSGSATISVTSPFFLIKYNRNFDLFHLGSVKIS